METMMDDTATRICSLLRHKAETFADEENEDKHETLEWSAACLIERQSAQIERMRRALEDARALIRTDRTALIASCTYPGGGLDAQDAEALADYDAVLAVIDEAMGESA